MTKRELINAIGKETNYMSVVVNEIKKLLTELEKKEPEIIQLTALASFAAQFYNGVENILKRICHFNNITAQNRRTGISSYLNGFVIRRAVIYLFYFLKLIHLNIHPFGNSGIIFFTGTVTQSNGSG